MSKTDVIEVEGLVTDLYPNAMFEVELENGHKILATVEMSPYDLTRGRITWRAKN